MVISQDPPAGSKARPNRRVDLVVSQEPPSNGEDGEEGGKNGEEGGNNTSSGGFLTQDWLDRLLNRLALLASGS